MASGYAVASGSDLDAVFAPQHSGWPQAGVTEFFDGSGNDLNLRYAPLSTGSAAAATKFVDSAGNDLNTVFAAYGSTNVQVLTQPSNVSGSAAAGNPSGTVTTGTTTCAGTKGKGSGYTYTWHFASGTGATFTAGSSATTAVTGNVPAGQTISGTMYCTISDGVTSVNTATVSWSLTNTTQPITVIPYTVSNTETQPTNAGASILFTSTGLEQYQLAFASPVNIGYWDQAGNGSAYDIYVSLVSGTAPNSPGYTNTLNTWFSLSTTRSWSITNSAFDGSLMTSVLNVQIRLHSTGVVQSTGQITLKARSNGTA